MSRYSLWAAVAVMTAGLAMPAQAQVIGSASRATMRSCSQTAANADCDGLGSGQRVIGQQFGGGVGVGGTTSYAPSAGNLATSTVAFDAASDLPIIRALTRSASDTRMNINTFAFQSFVYTGAAATAFSIAGALHMVDSSLSALGGARPGGAIFSQYVGIWSPSILNGLTTAQDLNNNLFYAGCDTEGVLAVGSAIGTLTGGNTIAATTTTTGCTPSGSLFLEPGQEVLVVAGLQLPVNRGGFADSTSTFTTRLGDDLSAEVKTNLATTLSSATDRGAVLVVPEPATWATMLMGFAMIAGVVRGGRGRRRSVAV